MARILRTLVQAAFCLLHAALFSLSMISFKKFIIYIRARVYNLTYNLLWSKIKKIQDSNIQDGAFPKIVNG